MECKRETIRRVKYWEIIARNLEKRGWSVGYVSAVDSEGRTIWITGAHRDARLLNQESERTFAPKFP